MFKFAAPFFLILTAFIVFSCSDNGTNPEFSWETVWTRPLVDSSEIYLTCLRVAPGGNILALGQSRPGESDPWNAVIMEIDTAANILDTIEIQPDLGGESIFPRDFVVASDNSFLITGSVSLTDRQLLALRASSAGSIVSDTALGGDQNEYGYGIVETADDGFAVVGWSASDIATSSAYYLCRFNQAGELQWQRKYIKGFSAVGRALTSNDGNGFLIGGTAADDFGSADYIYLLNVGATGDTVWSKQLGGTGNDLCEDILKVTDGYIVAGWTGSMGAGEYDIYLAKVDFDGNTVWEKALGSSANESFKSISETADGGFILTAMESGAVTNNATAYIVKANSSGDNVWEIYLQVPIDEIVGAFELDADNILVVTQTENDNGTSSSNLMKIKISGV